MTAGTFRVQAFLALAEATVCIEYPASAKAYLAGAHYPGMAGLLTTRCRTLGADGKPKGATPFPEHVLAAFAGMASMQVRRDHSLPMISEVYL
jgi:hypothetical protein